MTLSLPEDVLRGAERLAIQRGISLEELIIQVLRDLVAAEDEYERARVRHLAILDHPPGLGLGAGSLPSRDDLHER